MANSGLTERARASGRRRRGGLRRVLGLLGGLAPSLVFVVQGVLGGFGVFVRRLVVVGHIGRRLPHGSGDRFGRNIAPGGKAREVADQPSQDDLPAVAHSAEIELAREGGGKEFSLLEGLAIVWGERAPASEGFLPRFVLGLLYQNTPILAPRSE